MLMLTPEAEPCFEAHRAGCETCLPEVAAELAAEPPAEPDSPAALALDPDEPEEEVPEALAFESLETV